MTNIEARNARRTAAIERIMDAAADETIVIYNVDFTEWKDLANRAFEEASNAVQRVYLDGDRSIESDTTLYFEMPRGLHNFPSKKFAKLVENATDSDTKTAALALIAEWKPLADALKAIKPRVTKTRKPRTTERKTPERTLDNTGTCAICGRNVKMDKAGKLVAHGYTIRYGWQEGNCFGVGYAPVEVSNEALVAYREMLNSYIDRTTTTLAAMKADTVEVYYDRHGKPVERGADNFPRFRELCIGKTEMDLRGAQSEMERVIRRISEWKELPLPTAA